MILVATRPSPFGLGCADPLTNTSGSGPGPSACQADLPESHLAGRNVADAPERVILPVPTAWASVASGEKRHIVYFPAGRARFVKTGPRPGTRFVSVTRLPGDILRLLAQVNGRRHEDVSLPALAALARRSPFALHRRFAAVVGETPKAYTARVRLARAAADLLATTRPV